MSEKEVRESEREREKDREKDGERDREEVSEWVSGGSGSEREEMTGLVSERHIENIERKIEKKMQVK